MSGALKVGPKAIAVLHHFEQCRLTAYRDAVGIPTIGWGMTYYPSGEKVKMGDTITQKQADDMFAELLERDFAGKVRKLVEGSATTPAQFGAMSCLAYNIGMANFISSTVLRAHKARDYDLAQSAFLMWNKAKGKVLAGLTRRRHAESALYRSDFKAVEQYTQGEVEA
jgi:GH24 family phage-related lysozyme (muramidase)